MSIFSAFSKKKKSERILVIDIGSSTVTGAFVEFGEGPPTIFATTTSDIAILSDLSLARFEEEMQKALHEVLNGLRKLRTAPPDRVAVYLASPWYASQVRVAKLSRPTPFVVSKAILNDMVTREMKAFEDEEIAGKLKTTEAIRVIESKTLQARLNGYPHGNPINISARELELSLFLSVAPEHTLAKIEEIIARDYSHRPIAFATFLAASFVVSRDLFPHQDMYLLVDIGGEVSDLSLVKDGALIQSISFPFGRNFMLRRLSTELKRSIAESITLCMLYMENKVESSIKDSCEKVLSKAKNEWLDAFQAALFSISNELSIPDTLLLTVDADVAPWFIETIRKEEFHQYALTEKEFKVVLLDSTLFHESLAFAPNVPRNPFIMIEVLANLPR